MTRPYAALHIPRAVGVEPTAFLRGVSDVLGRRDTAAPGVPKTSDRHAAVAGDTLIVKVDTEFRPGAGCRVVFRIAPRPGRKAPGKDRAVAILSDIVLRVLPLVEARHVEWLDPSVALAPEEFQSAQNYTSRRRRPRRPACSLPNAEESVGQIERNLMRMMQDDKPLFEPQAPAATKPAAPAPSVAMPAKPSLAAQPWDDADFTDEDPAPVQAQTAPAPQAGGIAARVSGALRGALAAAGRLQLRRSAQVGLLAVAAIALHGAGLLDPVLTRLGQ